MSMTRGASMGLMRRMSQDPDIAQHQLSPGVVWRVLRFAKPYRSLIAVFVVLVVISAALAVAPPLLFGKIIDHGVLQGDQRLVIIVSLTVAGIWLCCRRCSGWCNAGFLQRSAKA